MEFLYLGFDRCGDMGRAGVDHDLVVVDAYQVRHDHLKTFRERNYVRFLHIDHAEGFSTGVRDR